MCLRTFISAAPPSNLVSLRSTHFSGGSLSSLLREGEEEETRDVATACCLLPRLLSDPSLFRLTPSHEPPFTRPAIRRQLRSPHLASPRLPVCLFTLGRRSLFVVIFADVLRSSIYPVTRQSMIGCSRIRRYVVGPLARASVLKRLLHSFVPLSLSLTSPPVAPPLLLMQSLAHF